jgi:hypothetical protein
MLSSHKLVGAPSSHFPIEIDSDMSVADSRLQTEIHFGIVSKAKRLKHKIPILANAYKVDYFIY